MGMNPDTNKFEMLKTVKDFRESIPKAKLDGFTKRMLGIVDDALVRPNGKPVPKHWSIFKVGQNVVIENYTFKVAYVGETSILFEPVGIVEIGKTK